MVSMMSAPVMKVSKYGTSRISDAHVLQLHLSTEQAAALLLLPHKPSLNQSRVELKQTSSLVLQLPLLLFLIAQTMHTGSLIASTSAGNHIVIPTITLVYMVVTQLVLITPLLITLLTLMDGSLHAEHQHQQLIHILLLCCCKEATTLQVAIPLIQSMLL